MFVDNEAADYRCLVFESESFSGALFGYELIEKVDFDAPKRDESRKQFILSEESNLLTIKRVSSHSA
jgi:hypothetical protein